MTAEARATKTLDLESFDRVVFTGHGELTITQGDRESLTIETHSEVLTKIKAEVVDGTLHVGQGRTLGDKIGFALETSLTRKEIRYALTVRKLASLELGGAFAAAASSIVTDRLSLKLSGPSHLTVDGLTAKALHVDMPVAGMVTAAGEAEEQQVSMGGPGNYEAPRLRSKKASITVKGPGKATVWATDELDLTILGIGSIEYYGSPKVRRHISGIGAVTRLGESPE
jgi:hypothetical protein